MAPKKRSRGTATLIDTTRFHFVDPLRIDVSPASTHEFDEILVREALCRGASEFDVMSRLERRKIREEAAGRRLGLEPLGWPADFSVVREACASLRETAQRELASLPAWVQASFDYDINDKALAARAARREPEPAWSRLDWYILMRAALYQNGYDDPAESVFGEITEGNLLGHEIIGGVHVKLREALDVVNKRLNEAPGDIGELAAREIKSVASFVPRFQALKQGQKGPPPLSNHALGLAIDIDFVSNPHIKEREVIAAMKQITGVDFGISFTPYSSTLPAVELAREAHRTGQQASDALRKWLERWLPVHLEMEERKKIKASFPSPDPETERQLGLLATILKYHKLWEVKAWKEKGIQTLPVELAAALVDAGLRWGSMYENHKDAMHFELLPTRVLRPDAKPRSPEDVLQLIAP